MLFTALSIWVLSVTDCHRFRKAFSSKMGIQINFCYKVAGFDSVFRFLGYCCLHHTLTKALSICTMYHPVRIKYVT